MRKEQVASAAPNYLFEELPTRLAKAPVSYKLTLQMAEQGEVLNHATVVWSKTRKQVELGILTIKTVDTDGVKFEKVTMFNLLALVDGSEPSDDTILLARSGAYAVSFGRR